METLYLSIMEIMWRTFVCSGKQKFLSGFTYTTLILVSSLLFFSFICWAASNRHNHCEKKRGSFKGSDLLGISVTVPDKTD